MNIFLFFSGEGWKITEWNVKKWRGSKDLWNENGFCLQSVARARSEDKSPNSRSLLSKSRKHCNAFSLLRDRKLTIAWMTDTNIGEGWVLNFYKCRLTTSIPCSKFGSPSQKCWTLSSTWSLSMLETFYFCRTFLLLANE